MRDPHPKPVLCSSKKVEDRWRGELIYEFLEDSSGIRVKWKHILQKPACWGVTVKFFVDNLEIKKFYSKGHKVDWVEIKSDTTFELKIRAVYMTEPKCFQASWTINMDNARSTNTTTTTTTTLLPRFTLVDNSKPELEETTTLTVTENTVVTNERVFRREEDDGGSENNNNTIVVAGSVGGSAVVLVSLVGIGLWRKKSRSSPEKSPEDVDENPVYGIYSDNPEDDYITFEDNNENYYASD